MDVLDAAYATVHDFPGGASALAPRAGFSSPHVLNSKVRPGCSTHHLTLLEADRLIGITGDVRVLRAMAQAHGYLLLPMPGADAADDGDVLGGVLHMDAAGGEFAGSIRAAVDDGLITRRELQAIERDSHSTQAAIVLLVRKLRTLVRQPPAAVAN